MIRRDVKEGWVLINQHDHAELSGEIMRFWGNKEFSRPEPYDEVLFAIRGHDNGWKEWDSSPRINPVTQYPMRHRSIRIRIIIWQSHYTAKSLISSLTC